MIRQTTFHHAGITVLHSSRPLHNRLWAILLLSWLTPAGCNFHADCMPTHSHPRGSGGGHASLPHWNMRHCPSRRLMQPPANNFPCKSVPGIQFPLRTPSSEKLCWGWQKTLCMLVTCTIYTALPNKGPTSRRPDDQLIKATRLVCMNEPVQITGLK